MKLVVCLLPKDMVSNLVNRNVTQNNLDKITYLMKLAVCLMPEDMVSDLVRQK